MKCLLQIVPGLLLMHSAVAQQIQYPVSKEKAKQIVAEILKTSPIIDGHNDLFVNYFDCKTCPKDLTDYPIDIIAPGQTDIPRMRQGAVGGLLMNIFGRERTLDSYMQAWDLLYRMQDKYSADLKIVSTAAEMRKGMQEGKITILPSLERSARLGDNKYLLRTYYKLGLRSVTFAYETNQFADGSNDTAKYNGISAKGKEMVKEMNRLGMLIDISHISSKAMNDILDITKAPIIFSHSNVKVLCNINRNVPDDVLKRLKLNGGIIMLCPVPYFTTNAHFDWHNLNDNFFDNLSAKFKKNRGDSAELDKIAIQWEKDNPPPLVTEVDLANHFDYVKKLIGVDYIGIAGDYDGIEYTIKGMEDVSTYPKLLIELIRRGWTVSEIRKITSGNFLRVFEEVEKHSKLK
ncbi:MAG: dipeptidase [Ferruginibacter sp.]